MKAVIAWLNLRYSWLALEEFVNSHYLCQSAATLENLSRLASKPGVQSTLILSKKDGSIIRSTGLLASASSTVEGQDGLGNAPHAADAAQSDMKGEMEGLNKTKSAEEIAKMVMTYVDGSNAFAEGMKDGDEVRLLRMRTRKNEIVIVPGKQDTLTPLLVAKTDHDIW